MIDKSSTKRISPNGFILMRDTYMM